MRTEEFLEREFKDAEAMLKDNHVKDVRVNFFLPARLLQFIRVEDIYDEKMNVFRSTRQDSVSLYFDEDNHLEQMTYKKQFNEVGRGEDVTVETIPLSKTVDGKDSSSLSDWVTMYISDRDFSLEEEPQEEVDR